MSNPYPGSTYWPADFGGCTLHGTYVGLDGAVVAGTITLAASPSVLFDFAALKVILPRALSVTLDAAGHFSILVPATDDPDISPIDWTYTITENFVGGRTYAIEAPLGGDVDITAQAGVPDANGTPIVRGPRGLDGAVLTVQGRGIDEASNVDLTPVVCLRANNLSDVLAAATARLNLGLGSAATQPSSVFAQATDLTASTARVAVLESKPAPGTMQMFAGFGAAPAGYFFCRGAAIDRTIYAALFAATHISTAAQVHANTTVDGIASTAGWKIGWNVSGPGIPAGATIASLFTNAITLSAPAAWTGPITVVVSPYGIGDGATTFNLPNFQGRVPVGVDAASTEFAAYGAIGGEKTHVLTDAEMPSHSHTVGEGLGPASLNNLRASGTNNSGGVGGQFDTGVAGSDVAHNNLQPYMATNYIIKY